MHVKRKKDFICLERVKGKIVNVLDGLELHTGVFSAVEQKRIVNQVYQLQDKGRKGELREHTFNAPRKWMRGKGRVTIQFGCCYNYAIDRAGNPPGILQPEEVVSLPPLFKDIIRRLIKWHVLPPTCVPDSCIVNIYDEGDCIPPHIDNHDFLRPFCTISFLSECDILFGSNLKIEGPGEFSGSYSIPLPVGSVLVLNGNGADVAKHCVPAVPTKRISITFRKMDESKRPIWFTLEPNLQGIEPLPLELNRSGSAAKSSGSNNHNGTKWTSRRRQQYDSRGYYNPERSIEQNDCGDWSSNQRRGKPR
ncbi:Oxoglutarate/iron-dependent dioxygenase [Arabidopsis suecica]|uniref:Oxoglutarate/iron-dependent dioxygenase n=1 Tax=Arabidopsis suecica TaxID=45249 RepID=A0A8T1ZE15_ARASU|nr:Oxoglutarate/iron-dependent dioxygenase [Arabidopsis suecica]